MVRRALFLAALVLAGSCGGAPPTSPSPTPPSATGLASGSYTLTLSYTPIFSCQNGFCTALSLCIRPAGAAPASSVSLPVIVQRDGDGASVAPVSDTDSLRIALQVSASAVTGSISGAATGSDGTKVSASGTVAGVGSTIVLGTIDGELSIGGTSCSNVTLNWSLGPR